MITVLLATNIWDYLYECDAGLLLAVNGLHSDYWDSFMRLYSTRKLLWIPLYVALSYAIYRSFGWRVLLWALVLQACSLLVTDAVASHLIKPYVGRLRPANVESAIAAAVHVVDGHRGGAFSFPSSHSGNVWSLAVLMSLLLRHRLLVFSLSFWALLMCYSRMYLGLHYPSDLLVGASLGVLCAWLSWLVLRSVIVRERGSLPDAASVPVEGALVPVLTLAALLVLIVVLSFFVRV